MQPEKQVIKQIIKPITVTKTKEVSQIKYRLGQGRAGLRHKILSPIPTLINEPITQATEKQPKVLVPKTPKIQDKVVPIPNYAILI